MRLREKPCIKLGHSPKSNSESVTKSIKSNRAKNAQPEIILRKQLWTSGVRGYHIIVFMEYFIHFLTSFSPCTSKSQGIFWKCFSPTSCKIIQLVGLKFPLSICRAQLHFMKPCLAKANTLKLCFTDYNYEDSRPRFATAHRFAQMCFWIR